MTYCRCSFRLQGNIGNSAADLHISRSESLQSWLDADTCADGGVQVGPAHV
jgi:hypothetical protein